MTNYDILDNYFNKESDNISLSELDLHGISDNIKEKISKLNLNSIKDIFLKIEKKLDQKLKEYDIDSKEIKKAAKQSTNDIYSLIHNGFENKKSVKFISSKLDVKIKNSVKDIIKNSTFSAFKIIGTLVVAFVIMMFIITVLLGLIHVLFGVNLIVAYLFILLFIFEIFEISVLFAFYMFDGNDGNTIVNYKEKIKKVISIDKMNENENEKIYFIKTFVQSFKSILSKTKNKR
jgi:ABC-type multidrug transport system fused ATPase/permease subunit